MSGITFSAATVADSAASNAAPNRRATVDVRVTEMDVFKQAVALLRDAYEALAAARSEGWEILSAETREEVCSMMDRIEEFAE